MTAQKKMDGGVTGQWRRLRPSTSWCGRA